MGALSAPGPWYANLTKSSLTPENWVFPVAWTFLYTCLAIYGWQLWQRQGPDTHKTIYTIQMICNFSWSYIFFKQQLLSLALAMIGAMIAMSIYMIIASIREKSRYWPLLVPYILWLVFAYYLADYIMRHIP